MTTKLVNLVIKRVDRVDDGANPHSDIILFKRRVRKQSPEPMTFDEIRTEQVLSDELWDAHIIFMQSVDSILSSDRAGTEKKDLVVTSLDQFLTAAEGLGADVKVENTRIAKARATDNPTQAACFATAVAGMLASAWEAKKMSKANELDLDAIPEAQRPFVVAIQKRVVELDATATKDAEALKVATGSVESLTKEIVEAKEQITKISKELDDLDPKRAEKRRLEAMPEDFRKRFEANEREVGELRADRETQAISKRLPPVIAVEKDALAGLLFRVEKGTTTKEDATELERIFKSISETKEFATLLKANGGGGAPAESGAAYDIAKRRAVDLVAKGQAKTVPEALTAVWTADPMLWDKHTAERTARPAE